MEKYTPRILVLFAILMAISWVGSINPGLVHGSPPFDGVSAASQTDFYDTQILRFIGSSPATTLTNPTSNTTFDVNFTFPANDHHITAGTQFLVRATGNVTTAAASNVVIGLNVTDADRADATVYVPGAITNAAWTYEGRCTVITAGASGTAEVSGNLQVAQDSSNVTCSSGIAHTTVPFAFDSTVAERVSVGAKFSNSNASNKITMKVFTVQTLR